MFGSKRRRAASNPPLNGNANANATSAAAQAFMKSRASNASLAAAAAGAALRASPTPPTLVADVQTKRTIRRAGSTSSMGSSISGSRGPPGALLERRGSSGSMTERTFRDPSPARSQPVPSAIDAPRVPAIPKSFQQTQSTELPTSHRRAASMEAPAMRVASPPPKMTGGRGVSLGPPANSPPRKAGQRRPNLSSVQEAGERPASRGSVNFSLPTSFRPESPVAQRPLTSTSPSRVNPATIISPTNQRLIYDPNTRSFLPEAEILAIEQKIQDASNRPIKKKKKIAPQQATGTHLAAGTAGGRPRGTAVDDMEASAAEERHPVELAAHVPSQTPITIPVAPSASEPPTLAPPARRKKKKAIASDSESDQGSYQPYSSDTDSDAPRKPKIYKPRVSGLLAKRPSVVREDKEREEEEDDTPPRAKAQDGPFPKLESNHEDRTVSPSPLPHSNATTVHSQSEELTSATFTESAQRTTSASPPLSPRESSPTTDGIGLVTRDSVRGGRVQSISPGRTAHFATTPESLAVKHQPPARATSPRKSAMKQSHSSSPRGPSPVGPEASEGSNMSNADDLLVPKKKANRVSFDDTNVAVGIAATLSDSPVVASPETKRPWFSIGRGKRKESSSVLDDDDDEIMKPRPALPSFGSIREKKTPREVEQERPLVKPTDTVQYQPLEPTLPPLFTSPSGEVIESPLGQSNDHALGAILSQDATSKNTANISKSREPLPPQVTSVEGSGYHSESDSSVYDLNNDKVQPVSQLESVNHGPENGNAETHGALASPSSEANKDITPLSEAPTVDIPKIAVEQPTPTLDPNPPRQEWPHIPGAWGTTESSNSDSEKEDPSPIVTAVHYATEPTVADLGISEPTPIAYPPGTPQVGEIAAQNLVPVILEEPEESEADSIYSDAAEDLSDFEGDGFMSLDAVVDSPISTSTLPGLAISTPPDSPTTMSTKERAYDKSKLSQNENEPTANEGWDKVQNYWSTLSADKRRELEQQALEEGEGSETEVESKPMPQPKKKKKAVIQEVTVEPPSYQQQAPKITGRQYMIQPGAKAGPNGHAPSSMKSSLRADPQNTTTEPHIRKSMRGPTSNRSLRGPAETTPQLKGSLQKKYRPMSHPTQQIKADPAAVQMHIRALSVASAAAAPAAAARDMAPKPTLRRKGSGDSQSSFKRARPATETPSMRTSMRVSADADRQQSPPRSSRFSLRSLSPNGSAFRRPFSANSQLSQAPSAPTHMRNSMRSTYAATPTMRLPTSRKTTFGRSSSKPSKSKATPKHASRFADSSDEEDDRPAFNSRFVDSSDEDEPVLPKNTNFRAVKLSTVTQDGDSSDLPDSDDEKHPKGVKKQNGTTSTSAQGASLATGSLRRSGSGRETMASPPTSPRLINTRRGSFMSSILRRKKDPSSKVRKSDAESPARRDTPLERKKSDLAILKAGEAGPRSSTPRLQRKTTESRQNSFTAATRTDSSMATEGWPLTVPLSTDNEDARPETADGVPTPALNGNGEKPNLGMRRFTATGLSGVDAGIGEDEKVEGVGRKKKKFGKLRRMFRLDD